MLPTLWPGDLLTVQVQPPEQAEPGEIVLCMRWGRFFIHRIVSTNPTEDEAFLITRGDCMPKDDPPVGRDELLGKVTEIRRAGSVFQPARELSPFRRILASMLCHWSLFRRIGLRLWVRRQKGHCQLEGMFGKAAS